MRRAAVLIVAVCIALLAWLVFSARDVSPRGDPAEDPGAAAIAADTQEIGETKERGRRRASAGAAARSPDDETTGEIDRNVEERLAAERGEVTGETICREIPAGSWRLVAVPIEGEARTAEVSVAPGAETVVDLRD